MDAQTRDVIKAMVRRLEAMDALELARQRNRSPGESVWRSLELTEGVLDDARALLGRS